MPADQGATSLNFDDEVGKLFIGGLSWKTTQGSLRDYFSKFGKLNDCVIMKNPATGRSRGFGFVRYLEPSDADRVISIKEHILDGKKIDPKMCTPKKESQLLKEQLEIKNRRKIFVGGLAATATEEDLKTVFSEQNLSVQEVTVMREPDTGNEKGKSRGFGFVTFEKDEEFLKVLQQQHVMISGKQAEIKRAEPKNKTMSVSRPSPQPPSESYEAFDSCCEPPPASMHQQQLQPARMVMPPFVPPLQQPPPPPMPQSAATYYNPYFPSIQPCCYPYLCCYPQQQYTPMNPQMPPLMTSYPLPVTLMNRHYPYPGFINHPLAMSQ